MIDGTFFIMIATLDLIILIFAVASGVFATSLIAHVQKCLSGIGKLKILIVFSVMALMLFLAGTEITKSIKILYPKLGGWMSVIIFGILGVRYILRAFKFKTEERFFDFTNFRVVLGVSVALGIDYLILGLGFAFLSYDKEMVLYVIPAFTFIATWFGLILGKKFGKFEWGNRMMYLGGLFLAAIAVKFILAFLNVL